jgi:hypothetical protein
LVDAALDCATQMSGVVRVELSHVEPQLVRIACRADRTALTSSPSRPAAGSSDELARDMTNRRPSVARRALGREPRLRLGLLCPLRVRPVKGRICALHLRFEHGTSRCWSRRNPRTQLVPFLLPLLP